MGPQIKMFAGPLSACARPTRKKQQNSKLWSPSTDKERSVGTAGNIFSIAMLLHNITLPRLAATEIPRKVQISQGSPSRRHWRIHPRNNSCVGRLRSADERPRPPNARICVEDRRRYHQEAATRNELQAVQARQCECWCLHQG